MSYHNEIIRYTAESETCGGCMLCEAWDEATGYCMKEWPEKLLRLEKSRVKMSRDENCPAYADHENMRFLYGYVCKYRIEKPQEASACA